jgi:hypothetical protein
MVRGSIDETLTSLRVRDERKRALLVGRIGASSKCFSKRQTPQRISRPPSASILH